MDVSLVIRRKKTTFVLDVTEDTTVEVLKKMIEGITKVPPEDQELYKGDQLLVQVMDPSKTVGYYGLDSRTAKPETPGQVGLAYRDDETGEFELLEIIPYSSPPELKYPHEMIADETMCCESKAGA